LSIESLISTFGTTLNLYRPQMTVSSDGKPNRTYVATASLRGFIQPGGQSSDILEGRPSGRTTATIYFAGAQDVRIDDELYSGTTGTVSRWRVVGAVNPGEIGRNFSAHRLNLTTVDAIQVDPDLAL